MGERGAEPQSRNRDAERRGKNASGDERTKSNDKRKPAGDGSSILDELLQTNLELQTDDSSESEQRIDTDQLVDFVRHGPVLEALVHAPLDRREIEAELGVSRATSHRFTRWLGEHDLAKKVDGRFKLTGYGQVVAEEVRRFERNLVTAERLAPLLEAICQSHKEFVIEPFADATITVASPADPYRPVQRFLTLLDESDTLRGFNTTHMVPLSLGAFHEQLFENVDTEIIYLPDAVEKLVETYPEPATDALERGHLKLRTREALPYGLAIFDDRVGIGGYDERTGTMQVFVDSETTIARKWAERVYDVYRERSEPLGEAEVPK
ncbi:Predicted transcriptional regulator, contains HTH domain [Haladaptatus litoreus]|uniref:Predicted transcriptional regulator, contains HTH domain n=1 Tax=Haladaptatus litoreus TaxID=553468 RepID=A0A1N7E4R0_9EURY|nr:MarR family transcriptional regulator [Haladaptatus litoreus]SIR83060.1 Predicted transcriptional regulator, contains HTH domain [Haladaptatus litoreus]